MISIFKPIKEGVQALRILPTLDSKTLETLASEVVKPTVNGVDKFINSTNPALNLFAQALKNEKDAFSTLLPKISGVLKVFEEQGGIWGNIATTVKQRATALEELLAADNQPATVVVRTAPISNSDAVFTSLLTKISQPVGEGALTLAPNSDSNALKTIEAYLTNLPFEELLAQVSTLPTVAQTTLDQLTINQLKLRLYTRTLQENLRIKDTDSAEASRTKLLEALLKERSTQQNVSTIREVIEQCQTLVSSGNIDNKPTLKTAITDNVQTMERLLDDTTEPSKPEQLFKSLQQIQLLQGFLPKLSS